LIKTGVGGLSGPACLPQSDQVAIASLPSVGKRAATVADGTLAETLSSPDEIVGADGWKVSFYSIHNAASASARKNTKNTTSISLVFVFMALPS
jgi:hypothetical protein